MKNNAVLLEKKTVMVYNAIMDKASFEYLTEIRRTLSESSDVRADVVGQLQRLGYKPKLSASDVYVDVGRGRKTMLSADASDGSEFEHMAVLILVARNVRGMKRLGVRIHFRFGTDVDCDDKLFDGVSEMYAVRTLSEFFGEAFGYRYGTVFAGSMSFECSFAGGDEQSAREYVESAARTAAKRSGVKLDIVGNAYTLVYYDAARGESALMEIERAALEADDAFRTEHDITATEVLPPIVNSALCVDRARAAAEYSVAVEPQERSDEYAQYLAAVDGCIVFIGDDDGASEREYEFWVRLMGMTA